MIIGYSCAYVKSGKLEYIIAFDKTGDSEEPGSYTLMRKILTNGVLYTNSGNTSTGVPSITNTNFYSIF